MKKVLSFILGIALTIVGLTVSGCGCTPEPISIDLTDELAAKTPALFTAFYNKPVGTTFASTAINENFYLDIIEDIEGTITSITINEEVFNNTDNVNFSVGNNNFVETPAFKLVDDTLQVAIPILSVEAKGGITKIMVGAQRYDVTLFASPASLTMTGVDVFFGDGEASKSTTSGKLTVSYARSDARTMVGWTLAKGQTTLAANLKGFVKKVYNDSTDTSYAIDVTENASTAGYTQGYYNYWANGPVTTPRNRTINFTTAIPGQGIINFDVVVTETLPS